MLTVSIAPVLAAIKLANPAIISGSPVATVIFCNSIILLTLLSTNSAECFSTKSFISSSVFGGTTGALLLAGAPTVLVTTDVATVVPAGGFKPAINASIESIILALLSGLPDTGGIFTKIFILGMAFSRAEYIINTL